MSRLEDKAQESVVERKRADVAEELCGHFVIVGMREGIQPEQLAAEDGPEQGQKEKQFTRFIFDSGCCTWPALIRRQATCSEAQAWTGCRTASFPTSTSASAVRVLCPHHLK